MPYLRAASRGSETTVKRNRWNPRKVLVASAGVATVNYALATGCDSGMGKMSVIANLMPAPGGFGGSYATVANLVAPPPEPPIEIPSVGGASSRDAGQGPSDASLPDAAADDAAADAAPTDTAAGGAGNDGGPASPDGGP